MAILLVMSIPVFAQTELRTAAQMGSDPKYIDTMAGRAHVVSGFCVDLYRAIERIEPGLHIVGDQDWQPAPRIEHLLTEGRLDIACALVRSPERDKQFLFIEPRVLAFNFRLAARTDDPVQIQNWNDVRKLAPDDVILVNHGWGYAHGLDELPGLHVDASAYSPENNLQKLVAGHGRFFYFREPGLSEAIHRAGVTGQVRILPAVMSAADVFMAVRPDLPAPTVAVVQHAIRQLEADGDLGRLAARWN